MRRKILTRAKNRLSEFELLWPREPIRRTGTEERFTPVVAKFVKLICEARDTDVNRAPGFTIDEFEVWSAAENSSNVALAEKGATATGPARRIEDFPGAYGAHIAIDGKTGERFISAADHLIVNSPNRPRSTELFSPARVGNRNPSSGSSRSSRNTALRSRKTVKPGARLPTDAIANPSDGLPSGWSRRRMAHQSDGRTPLIEVGDNG